MKTSPLRGKFLTFGFMLAATVAASAQQSSISFTNSATAAGTGAYVSIALGKFDTGLGVLDSVTVTVESAVVGGSFSIGAPSASSATYDGAVARITVRQVATNSLGFSQIGQITNSVTTTPAPGFVVPGLTTNTFDVDSLVAITNNIQSIDSAFWSAYSSPGGTGDVVFQARNSALISVSGASFSVNSTLFTGETTMSVTYVYTIPEPSTYALLALSGLGLAVLMVRRGRC